MPSMQSQPQERGGRLVALEGDVDTVATQLRLLPPSQKILVLPSLLDDLPQDINAQSFNARALIRDVYAAFVDRTERARSFLQSSTTTQPRLVFMNGGSVKARTTCITRICENITNGDVREAKIIFNEVVKDGVAGLTRNEDIAEEEVETIEEDDADGEDVEDAPERVEDPSFKAMKAADSLDRETAELQEDSAEDNIVGSNENSTAVPETQAEVPEVREDVITSETRDQIVGTLVTVPREAEVTQGKRSTFGSRYPASPTTPFTSTTDYTAALSQQTDEDTEYDCDDEYAPELASPGHDSFFSVPPTPAVVYGEACVVDLQAVTPKKSTRKVKSFDKLYPKQRPADWDSGSPRLIRHSKSAYHLGRPSTSSGRLQAEQDCRKFQTLPRTAFIRASTTTIKKISISDESIRSSVSTPKPRVFIDRGTDAGDMVIEEEPEESAPFEPVFPVVEDLVIHFSYDDPCDIFEYVISAYKNGSYPTLPSPETESSSVPASPSSTTAKKATTRPISHLTAETDDDGYHRRHEFDPYAANNYSGGVNQWPLKHSKENSGQNLQPPSPSPTPPPSARGVPNKFCEFSPMKPNSVIGIQNSLRSLLNLHFPAGENGYTQYSFPVAPEMERLWKPVFRNDENSSIGSDGRTVDQIIALGCEEGVKKDLFSQISGQIEKLGTKRDGLNRSSKIDLRYFIANVMQTHSTLPLNIQSTFNPLTSPEVLATCIVPHIEAYLAINTSTRLLILHYPSDHLATVMALRNTLGPNILKIAGIMDSLSSDPPSNVSRPRTPTANPLSNEATSKRLPTRSHSRDPSQSVSSINSHNSNSSSPNHQAKKSEVSFSKANYLLPSIATDAEVATFLSGIWMSLMEISTFYIPEPEPKPTIIEKFIEKPPLPPTPATSPFTQRDASHPPISLRQSSLSRESKLARLTGNSGMGSRSSATTPPRTPTGGKTHKYAASVSTVRTTASERVRREDARVEKEWEHFYIGEEDSEDDDYDRMVMGRALAKIVPEVRMVTSEGKVPKRSTKKALKWLGLA